MDHRSEPQRDAYRTHGDRTQDDITVEPTFVLLFAVQLNSAFDGFRLSTRGITPLTPEHFRAYDERLSELERHVFGQDFVAAGRTERWPLGRIAIDDDSHDVSLPPHADVYLVTHSTGTAVWEAWFTGPSQPLNALQWIGWLDPDTEDGLPTRIWRVLASANHAISGKPTYRGYFPLTIIRAQQAPLETILDKHGEDVVRLLLRSRSKQRFRPEIVGKELAQNYCLQEGGLTLISRRSGLDLHGREDVEEKERGFLPLSSALPFLIIIESLLIERTVLQQLYERLSQAMPATVEELLTLKQQILDGLEEYYGAITNANRIGDEVANAAEAAARYRQPVSCGHNSPGRGQLRHHDPLPEANDGPSVLADPGIRGDRAWIYRFRHCHLVLSNRIVVGARVDDRHRSRRRHHHSIAAAREAGLRFTLILASARMRQDRTC